MPSLRLSRRQFARTLGAAVGAAAVVRPIFELPAESRQPSNAAGEFVQLNANENPYGPFPEAIKAMQRSAATVDLASRYPDSRDSQLVEALAALHKVKPDQILLGCGSGEILRVAAEAFLGPDKNVVAADPTFEAVLGYARVAAANPIKIPLTSDFRHNLPAMAAAMNEKTGLVFVCNPNNPTGTLVSRDELASFIKRTPPSTTILLDEAYHHFVEDPSYASGFTWLSNQPNLVIVRTFSKIYGMAGMRLGYAIGHADRIAAMNRHLVRNNTNAAVLEAALAGLNDEVQVVRQRKLNNDTRAWVCREFEKDGRRYIPSHTNFVMVDVRGDVSPHIEEFRKRKVLVGRKFPPMDTWMRVSIGTQKQMEAFLTAFRAIQPASGARSAAA